MVCFVISGGICGWEQWAAPPSSVPQRPGQRAAPCHKQQGAQEGRRAYRDGAYLLHTGEHHLERKHPTYPIFFNPDHNSVSGTSHQCCHRFQGNKSIQRANQTTSKVCIHLIHSRVERSGLTLSGFLISPSPAADNLGTHET